MPRRHGSIPSELKNEALDDLLKKRLLIGACDSTAVPFKESCPSRLPDDQIDPSLANDHLIGYPIYASNNYLEDALPSPILRISKKLPQNPFPSGMTVDTCAS